MDTQYTKVIKLAGTYSIGVWNWGDNVVADFFEREFDNREDAEAYRKTLGYKERTQENERADYEAYVKTLED